MDEPRNTWVGTTAIAFAILAWVLLMVMTALLLFAEFYIPGGIDGLTDDAPLEIAAALSLAGAMIAALIALGLAIAGLVSRKQKRFLPGLAMGLSLLLYLVVAGLFVYGVYFAQTQ